MFSINLIPFPLIVFATIAIGFSDLIDNDLIISTGKAHSVKYFAECALRKVGVVELEKHIRVKFEFPPSNIPPTIYGDNSKIQSLIPWKPRYSFEEMISEIMGH